ncbi:uncharacterized protein LOC135835751 [Planococcus citri]|uniref:uncharacterized protein LOC135835751 n=1 Tax=Planococcus citri TaxID=170843 RepID=UPI0031F8DCB3
MKITTELLLLTYLTLTMFCSTTMEDEKQLSLDGKFHQTQKEPANGKKTKLQSRLQRQNRQPRPPSLFGAVSSLLGGSVVDTFTAYRNVSRLVQGAFAPPRPTTTNQTAPSNATSFTLRQALALLGKNYRGLRKLFDKEFTKALNDSYENVYQFRKELKQSARMSLEFRGNAIR